MSRYMQRCLVLGPGGTIGRNGELINGFQDYRAADTATTFAETGTSWVRLWADWPTLQPDPRYLPSDPQSPGSKFWGILVDQIHRARGDGLKIILTLYRYPKWATAAGSEPNPERRDW